MEVEDINLYDDILCKSILAAYTCMTSNQSLMVKNGFSYTKEKYDFSVHEFRDIRDIIYHNFKSFNKTDLSNLLYCLNKGILEIHPCVEEKKVNYLVRCPDLFSSDTHIQKIEESDIIDFINTSLMYVFGKELWLCKSNSLVPCDLWYKKLSKSERFLFNELLYNYTALKKGKYL